jgi:hypothetical protein
VAIDRAGDDVRRLFRQLVYTLADTRPDYLHRPFQVSELYQDILPYRLFRSRLQFDTNEDYEMAVLRLLAGQGDLVALEPSEAGAVLAQEAEAINPLPGAFRDFAAARVTLNPVAVRELLDARDAYAPIPTTPRQPPLAQPVQPAAREPEPPDRQPRAAPLPYAFEAAEGTRCPNCQRPLPRHRAVIYCPFCGEQVAPARCSVCGTELEAGWTFCITCGHRSRPETR